MHRGAIAGETVLSPAQRRLWFLDWLHRGRSTDYNLPIPLRLQGRLDRSALVSAVAAIAQRHDVLRTRFADRDGDPVQIVEPLVDIPFAIDDLRDLDAPDQEQAIQRVVEQEWDQPFDLRRAPPMRMRLLQLDAEQHVFVRNIHHIAFDAWSHGVWNRELVAHYAAFSRSERPRLPPLTAQYADYAIWVHEQLATSALSEGLDYWCRRLEGLPECHDLPTHRPRAPLSGVTAGQHHVQFDAAQVDALRRFSREQRVTLFMTLLAALAAVLARHGRGDDLVIGTPIANRTDERFDDLIGCFVNFVPVRLNADPSRSLASLLEHVREKTLDAFQYGYVPFDAVVERLAPRRRRDLPPLFQIMFVFQNVPWLPPALDGLNVAPIARDCVRVTADVELYAKGCDGGLDLEWRYSAALFDHWRIVQMASHYERMLAAVVSAGAQRIRDVGLLNGVERDGLLRRWSSREPTTPWRGERLDAN